MESMFKAKARLHNSTPKNTFIQGPLRMGATCL